MQTRHAEQGHYWQTYSYILRHFQLIEKEHFAYKHDFTSLPSGLHDIITYRVTTMRAIPYLVLYVG